MLIRYDQQLAAVQPPQFEFYDPQTPIYTSPRFLPPAKIVGCKLNDVIISHGSYLEECTIENAVVGLRSRIGKDVVIQASPSPVALPKTGLCWGRKAEWSTTGTRKGRLERLQQNVHFSIYRANVARYIGQCDRGSLQDAMVMGADYYESEEQRERLLQAGRLPIGVGAGSMISNTIVDKNARIGENCQITNKDGIEEANRESEGFYIRSGIVTVLRNAEIPNGTIL